MLSEAYKNKLFSAGLIFLCAGFLFDLPISGVFLGIAFVCIFISC